jgi:phosphoglucomutase
VPAEKMISNLEQMITDPTTVGKSYSYGGKTFTIAKADNFEYTDPIDHSVSRKQAS